MGKRKTSAPKRASDEKRHFMTWSMVDGATSSGSLSVIGDNDPALLREWEASSQDVRHINKHNKKEESLETTSSNSVTSDLEDIFNLYLENCLYCVTIVNKLLIKEGEWCCEIGRFIVRLLPGSSFLTIPQDDLPQCEECWLYVAGADGKSMLYFELQEHGEKVKQAGKKFCKHTTSMFWCVEIDLPLSCLEGLQVKCFQVVRGRYDECNETLELIIYATESILLQPKFSSEPVRPKKSHSALQELMKHFYGFSPMFCYDGLTSSKKHDIEQLYTAVMGRQSRLEICHNIDVQHPSLKPLLRPYQRDSVHWMLHQEKYNAKKETKNIGLHQLYEEVTMKDGKTLYYNKHCGSLVKNQPLSSAWPPGGILADEMGLGKTVEVLCCMMLHPRSQLPLPERLHTLRDEQEFDSEEMNGIIDHPASVNNGQSDDSIVSYQTVVPDLNVNEIVDTPVTNCGSLFDDSSMTNQLMVIEQNTEICDKQVSMCETVVESCSVVNQPIVLEQNTAIHKTRVSVANQLIIHDQNLEIHDTPLSVCETVVDNSSVANQPVVLEQNTAIHKTPVSVANQLIVLEQNMKICETPVSVCETVVDNGSVANQPIDLEQNGAIHEILVDSNSIPTQDIDPNEEHVLVAKEGCVNYNDDIPVVSKDHLSGIESSMKVSADDTSSSDTVSSLGGNHLDAKQDVCSSDERFNHTNTLIPRGSAKSCVDSSRSSLCVAGIRQPVTSTCEISVCDIGESCNQENCELLNQNNTCDKNLNRSDEKTNDICDKNSKQTESDCCDSKKNNLLNVCPEKTDPCDSETKETHACDDDKDLTMLSLHGEVQVVTKLKNIFSTAAVSKRAFFECICGSRDGGSEDLLKVQCVVCSLWQHAQCMKYDLNNPYRGEYKCPHCHVISPPISSGATLIISPATISHQWEEEIQKHIKKESLKVFVYTGVNKLGYIQPQTLASYDIVITMYETLRKEIDYVDLPHSNSETGRRFRHPKRFMAIPSPIISVEWWRICLDEAQMVECTTTKTADMALRLTAVNRWCVTGTPIQKSVEDLYGLVLFLGMDPYWVQQWWKKLLYEPFCYGIDSPMYDTLSQVLWRTAKKDVLDQIQLPSQTEQVHWLTFSPVEDHFYRRQFRDCVKVSMENLSKWSDSSTRLSSLDRHTMGQLLHPLLKLRQACCHPQAVRGEFLPIHKSTLTMEELLESLTKKAKVECEEAHRQLVAGLNGLAAIHMIKLEYVEAVDKYREVLRSVEEHKNDLRTDDLQQLHALHNLHEVLSVKPTGVHPTLRDDHLLQQSQELRQKYMLKVGSKVQSAMENLLPIQTNIQELKAEFADGSDWWNELLDWVKSHQLDDGIIERIREDLSGTHEMNSMLYRFRDLRGLEYLLYSQLSALDSVHTKLVSQVNNISDKPSQDIVNQTVECCLRPEANILKTCPFCQVDELFNEYESKLFSFVERGVSTVSDGDDPLYQVNTRRQGTWADSELEVVIKAIYNFGRIHRLTAEYKEFLEYGNTHIKLFDTLKKEFKHLRNVWLAAREQVSSLDELDMATTRLRVRLSDEPVPETPQPHVLEKGQVDLQRMKLLGERATGSSDLKKRLGQLVYLQNLAKTQIGTEGDGLNPEPCPICQRALGAEWSVLQCCHCFCLDCIRVMVDNFSFGGRHRSLRCALCRQGTRHGEISYVSTRKNHHTDDDISVKGSHSTKVEAVVRCLLQIHKTDPQAKALVFSTWQDVLGIIEQALTENSITSLSLHTPGKFQKNLTSFREDDITALLLPVHSGSNGLNLIEATHVLLVEPILNPAQELQAVGRVHRIGQTRPTIIHRFLVRGTIEERINTMVKSISESPDIHDTSELALTIGQLTSLFQEDTDDVPMEDEIITSHDSQM